MKSVLRKMEALSALKKEQLKEVCKNLGLPVSGNKEDLRERLLDFFADDSESTVCDASTSTDVQPVVQPSRFTFFNSLTRRLRITRSETQSSESSSSVTDADRSNSFGQIVDISEWLELPVRFFVRLVERTPIILGILGGTRVLVEIALWYLGEERMNIVVQNRSWFD